MLECLLDIVLDTKSARRVREDDSAVYLGPRRIRSAGRSSGSIEITLPVELEVLGEWSAAS